MKIQIQPGLRAWPRANIPATAYLFNHDRTLGPYQVENLSAGGTLISGGPDIHIDAHCLLLIDAPQIGPLVLDSRIVRKHDVPGGGHTYGVAFINVHPDTEDLIQNAILAHLEIQAGPASVLVVDDCTEMRHAMKRDLRALDRPAVLASMPLEALEALRIRDRKIDVAIVDLRLGSADGIELLKYIHKEYPSIRRVLISGEVNESQLNLALIAGYAHAVIPKPWSREQIAKALAA